MTICLRRSDPARNMRRFYRLDIQPDLFGRVLYEAMGPRWHTGAHDDGILRQRNPRPCRLAAAGRAQAAARVCLKPRPALTQ